MRQATTIRIAISMLMIVAAFQTSLRSAAACSRFVYLGDDGNIFTARSMDWAKPIDTNLYVLPAGMERDGGVGPNSIKWTSKYGSLVAPVFNSFTSDGVNEEGLMANILWLEESQYPEVAEGGPPGLAISAWAQYALDNFATVAEAVAEFENKPFTLVTSNIPGVQLPIPPATARSSSISMARKSSITAANSRC